ncbi:response regulator [Brevundimonas sp. BR2-1]|uniref:response regulator n=1 Tax=unclassified Brevundimonas TaxID=2622653 RepID=UPI002FC8FD80
MANILVVDDDPTVRMIASEILTRAGHEVSEAADGDEALKQVGEIPFDLVVLDMLMPNKDGLETIAELRGRRPPMRILAISSGGRMDAGQLLRMALVFGADETMAKPLRSDALTEAVSRLLAMPKSEA